MFKLYSKGCEYAIRALAHAVADSNQDRFQAKDICEKAGIPESFTRKIFQSLVQGGFLLAHRGPGGGYSLSVSPEKISILDVIKAVDGEDTFSKCIMGLSECGGENPCPLHPIWSDAKHDLIQQLSQSTLREVIDATLRRDAGDPSAGDSVPLESSAAE